MKEAQEKGSTCDTNIPCKSWFKSQTLCSPSSSLLMGLRKQKMARTHTAPAFAAIWGVNHWVEDLSLCLSPSLWNYAFNVNKHLKKQK